MPDSYWQLDDGGQCVGIILSALAKTVKKKEVDGYQVKFSDGEWWIPCVDFDGRVIDE